jgi:DNA-binding winged helix-turn-helix (wHTH) protein
MEVRLTPKEFDLFLYLARRPNRVIGHRQLLGAVWGEASQEHPEYLRVFVGQLRKKLEAQPSMPRYLATEPWVGYRSAAIAARQSETIMRASDNCHARHHERRAAVRADRARIHRGMGGVVTTPDTAGNDREVIRIAPHLPFRERRPVPQLQPSTFSRR